MMFCPPCVCRNSWPSAFGPGLIASRTLFNTNRRLGVYCVAHQHSARRSSGASVSIRSSAQQCHIHSQLRQHDSGCRRIDQRGDEEPRRRCAATIARVPLVVLRKIVFPATRSAVKSPGLLPRSNPGGGRHLCSPARSFGPSNSEAASFAASSEPKTRTSFAPDAIAVTIVVVAHNTSKTTTARSRR